MTLYRFEAIVEGKEVALVVAAQSEEEAFQFADIELEKHFLKVPQVDDLSMNELKKIRSGVSYVIEIK
ncbi:MAG TPA: DUF3906 family protein [Massilibacterium sp.]|nr:DUF3906 family protein [Massilibacterium sp.]